VRAGEYLVEAWDVLGRVERTPGVGSSPLRFTEIVAAHPWTNTEERRALREMSEAYMEGVTIGEDVLGIPPWSPGE
jgi:hypothetical protein